MEREQVAWKEMWLGSIKWNYLVLWEVQWKSCNSFWNISYCEMGSQKRYEMTLRNPHDIFQKEIWMKILLLKEKSRKFHKNF